MDQALIDNIKANVKLSKENLEEARVLLEQELWRGCISRAYYAMFHLAQAALLTKGIERTKHSATISAFGELFAKPGLIDRSFHKDLQFVFEQRQDADYDTLSSFDKELATDVFNRARKFASHLEAWIEDQIPL
ncbi:MAG: HEPN domain-containing protein [Firmicutes bacterium]|nr:HEPN domain-containing protein [Bacillota bacterium]